MAKFHHIRFLLEDTIAVDKNNKDDYGFECYSDCNQYFLSHSPSKKDHMSKLMIIMSFVMCCAVFLFLAFFAIRRYRSRNSRRNNSPPLDQNSFGDDHFIDELQGPVIDHPIWYIRTIGLPENVINSITVFKYQKRDSLIEGSDCSVCLNEFQEDESLRLLPKCSHAFHVSCIDTWLRSHKSCPVCRAPIVVENGNSDSEVSLIGMGSRDEIEIVESGEIRNEGEDLSVADEKLAETLSIGCWENNARNGDFRVVSDLSDHHRVKVDQNLQPRRSVSMDFSCVSMIFGEVEAKTDEGCWDSKLKIDSNVMEKS